MHDPRGPHSPRLRNSCFENAGPPPQPDRARFEESSWDRDGSSASPGPRSGKRPPALESPAQDVPGSSVPRGRERAAAAGTRGWAPGALISGSGIRGRQGPPPESGAPSCSHPTSSSPSSPWAAGEK